MGKDAIKNQSSGQKLVRSNTAPDSTRPKRKAAFRKGSTGNVARSRSSAKTDTVSQTAQKLPGNVRKGKAQLKPHPKHQNPGVSRLARAPDLALAPEESNVRKPTVSSDNRAVMPWGKAAARLKEFKIKSKETIESEHNHQIMAAVQKYKDLPTLLETAVKSGKPEDYEAATRDLINLLVDANDTAGKFSEYEDAEAFVADGSLFADAVLTRVLFLKDDTDVENLRKALDGKGQQFVDSIPPDAGTSAQRRAQTKAATAFNLLQDAFAKRVDDPTPVPEKTAPKVHFEEAKTEHRYREKPSISASRAMVDVARAAPALANLARLSPQNKEKLRMTYEQLGESLGWVMWDGEPKARWQIGAQLKAMTP